MSAFIRLDDRDPRITYTPLSSWNGGGGSSEYRGTTVGSATAGAQMSFSFAGECYRGYIPSPIFTLSMPKRFLHSCVRNSDSQTRKIPYLKHLHSHTFWEHHCCPYQYLEPRSSGSPTVRNGNVRIPSRLRVRFVYLGHGDWRDELGDVG